MSQWFAPSRLVITFERDGPGAFSTDEIRDIAIRGGDGLVLGLNLPKKSVLIANHQVPVPKKLPAVTSPLPLVGLCRLVVCLVSDVLYGYSPGRMHRLEEKSPMGPCPRMGIVSQIPSSSRALPLTAPSHIGHAILQLHLPCPLLGFRPSLSRKAASSPRSKSSRA